MAEFMPAISIDKNTCTKNFLLRSTTIELTAKNNKNSSHIDE